MILALDSYYKDDICNTSLVVFVTNNSEFPYYIDTIYTKVTSDYIPGEFYKRELPGIIQILYKLKNEHSEIWERITIIIIDSFITLKVGDKIWGGLGYYLKEYLDNINENRIIIGVAKSKFGDCEDISYKLYRGESKTPLFIQSTHHNNNAAGFIKGMHGKYRIPTMLKLVDQLSRIFPDTKKGNS